MEKSKTEYMTDCQGRLVPLSMVKDIDKLRDQTIKSLYDKFKVKADDIKNFRQEMHNELMTFAELSAEQYGVKLGGKKGNISITSFDGSIRIEISNNDILDFNEQLQTARELISDCINRWSEGSRPEIRVLIDDAFKTDKRGMVSASRVLGLRRLNIEDTSWQTAMRAITDSLHIVSSRKYIRFYVRDAEGKYQLQSLDLTTL